MPMNSLEFVGNLCLRSNCASACTVGFSQISGKCVQTAVALSSTQGCIYNGHNHRAGLPHQRGMRYQNNYVDMGDEGLCIHVMF